MYKTHFSRFLDAAGDRLHFAAHSHHYWPDATRGAMVEYWDDTARLADDKWGRVFDEVVPEVQRRFAATLDVDRGENVAFGPNTHEFLVRLLSCFDPRKRIRVLTTDGEFHSFSRQMRRMEEAETAEVVRVPVEPYESFEARFRDEAAKGGWDLVFFSHVFFDSGFRVMDLDGIVRSVDKGDGGPDAMIVVDGYHAFFAVPFSLRNLQDRVFYLGGGYKYAMSGEAMGFLYTPSGTELRPWATGWFADFEGLQGDQSGPVGYGPAAMRFWGATFDPIGVYRFAAVSRWMGEIGLDVAQIDRHIKGRQQRFLDLLADHRQTFIDREELMWPGALDRLGHFFTLRSDDAQNRQARLKQEADVWTDVRGDRLRFGFGLYHEDEDVDALFERMVVLS